MQVMIDGNAVEVEPGATLLEAIRGSGGQVASLCYDERLDPFGACRVCMVGVKGAPGPLPSCTTLCREGMEISTTDETALRVAGAVVELVLSELPEAPGEHTELAAVAKQLNVTKTRWTGAVHEKDEDLRHPYLAFRHELCISCGRCVRACDEVQGAFALTVTGRGFSSNVAAGVDSGFAESSCVSCGACADTCPTDAIVELRLLELAIEQNGSGK